MLMCAKCTIKTIKFNTPVVKIYCLNILFQIIYGYLLVSVTCRNTEIHICAKQHIYVTADIPLLAISFCSMNQ